MSNPGETLRTQYRQKNQQSYKDKLPRSFKNTKKVHFNEKVRKQKKNIL
jgi:hypothetical protein